MNFPESSLANLSSLGYTEDEARFLYLVATHSGYFSMRQFLQFTGTKSGDKSMTFSQKLLAKGHATARSFLRNGLVYHPILPHRVPSHRPGKPSQPPCAFARTHSHTARCPGLRPDAFAVRISRNRGRQTELLLPTTGHPERTLAQEAVLRSRSQHNDRALLRGQVPHVPLSRHLLSPCGYLHLRGPRTWHPRQFQDPSAGLWKSVRSASRGTARLYFASSNAVRDCAKSLSGRSRSPSKERPGRRNPPLFPASEAV